VIPPSEAVVVAAVVDSLPSGGSVQAVMLQSITAVKKTEIKV
jgi:hypothetical protein